MITAQEVIDWMGVKNLPANDLTALTAVVSAVNFYVDNLPNIDREEIVPGNEWKATTKLGAIMLAARIYRRKNSPGGIEAVGDMTTYVSRYDADIARLLHIDSFRKPMVG